MKNKLFEFVNLVNEKLRTEFYNTQELKKAKFIAYNTEQYYKYYTFKPQNKDDAIVNKWVLSVMKDQVELALHKLPIGWYLIELKHPFKGCESFWRLIEISNTGENIIGSIRVKDGFISMASESSALYLIEELIRSGWKLYLG